MENSKRYEFDGFTFGAVERYFNLKIGVLNNTGIGTSTAVELAIELTNDERLALIGLLLSVDLTGEDGVI